MKFGVCYYPEHWPEAGWADDARRMADTGLQVVRIGEFAWSRVEPQRGDFHFGWLDRAVDVLGDAGLHVVMGTPTATPPKWLIDERPDILAADEHGRPRRFGSRRHYCFSSQSYREESVRIATHFAERYGRHEAITGWQIDNEYGCHETVRSYSDEAARAFRVWLEQKYSTPAALNDAWGNVFWSQEYQSFSEIDLPLLTVTEANPAHVLDFYRFSSDQVISYHRLQADIVRDLSPGREVYHNAMGHFTDFDHFELGQHVDVLGWDSYPLGFLDNQPYSDADKDSYLHQGHPDFAGFHHDLYRACADKWGLLELQPGPVNWAPHNPAPLPGMVDLWLAEAAAHGADVGCVFRWRQAPFAQEQFHAGLLRVDGQPAPGLGEVRGCASDLVARGADSTARARVAVLFDYETQWMSEIQPQGDWNYFMQSLQWYGALRRQGLNVDVVRRGQDLSTYDVVLVPSLFHIDDAAMAAFEGTSAHLVFGPRSGSKTGAFSVPDALAPGPLQKLIPVNAPWSESLPRHIEIACTYDKKAMMARRWLDHIETELHPIATTSDGRGALYRHDRVWYFATLPEDSFLDLVIADVLSAAEVDGAPVPEGVRVRTTARFRYVFNYAVAPRTLSPELTGGDPEDLPPACYAAYPI